MSDSEMMQFIWSLKSDEISDVLADLLEADPGLTKKVYDIALKVVGDVDPEDVMEDVFYELEILDLDDLTSRSGRTQHGYVEPYEAAWELFEEKLEPFIDEMRKNQNRTLPAAAKNYCIGIIKGILKYEEESDSDFKGWVEDAPGEYINTVFEEWKKGNPDDDAVAEVAKIIEEGSY